ncbi:NADase-type glycan-binding domain-containing protein [Sinisalibacter lacisalsi]|uniref:NAD glycohydrolase translocation F5/8 type C domain-containing protein n=1 Tax=Sinisalibacter lacisalsi TaxID=1526570 RepID=A0ABQ1QLM8_9RHOB|nr:hypothetical protein [Sinisalibacter lacisalsi]GGD29545.1 hypothetical protein GCM10011358_11960 [Sinisalibacter lacisalsi]
MPRLFTGPALALATLLAAAAPVVADVSVRAAGAGQYFDELRYWASSVLPPQSGNSYGVENLFDGSDRTAWCEGVAGNGAGERITVSFGGSAMPLRLLVKNGYAKSADVYFNNARPRSVEIRTSAGAAWRTQLADTTSWQSLTLPDDWVDWVSLTIVDVYPGAKWTDTCVTALQVDFEGY